MWERIASATTDLLSLVDRNYIYRAVNDSYLRVHNRSREEIVGHSARELLGPEAFDKSIKDYVDRCLAGEQVRYQSWVNYPTLGRRFMDVSYHPCFDVDGTISGVLADIHDITDLQTTKEALIQSEERYQTILQEIQDSYFEANLAGNFTFFNETTHRDLGYSREELMGMNYRAYAAPEDAETMYKAFNQVYRTGKTIRTTAFKVVTKDGVIKFAESWVSPLRNERGEIVGFRGLSRDITEHKRVEEALRQSEERYRTILDEMQDDYFEVDLAGNFTFVNEANARQLGYPKEELIGMDYRGYIHPDDVENVYKTFNQVYREGQPIRACVFKIVRKDGSTGLGELSVFPLRNDKGEIIGFRGIGRDIAERMQMIEALRQSEERYRTVLEDMEESYYEIDLAGNFTFFNDALCRRLGYSREELMGMNYRVFTPPENVKKVLETYNRVYRTGEPVKSFPVERIRKDGTRIFAEFSAFPLQNEKGEIIGFRGIVRDVTERKQAELERKQMEQRAQFASRLASVGELASGVAHEINNPLTGVIGYAHLLLDRKDISQDIRHDLEIINEGAQRVAAIIRKLLTFARQQKPEQRFANINEIISTTLDLRTYELASNNIRVAFQPARDLPMTIVDSGQLQQVFLNLIINAETEMKLAKGGGKLSIKTEQVDNTIRISFKDNGPGIAKENLEKIFDPFFTTREVGQGTGLGLNVCHGIITEHKGKIWVESKLGRGANFIVELPIVAEDSQLVLLEPAVEEPKKVTKAKILVIDDEPVIRQFVSRVLSEEGHEVEAVDKAEDALKKIKSKRYRLILLDIKMPGISGIELYKQFQEIAPSLMKRVVFITGDVMGKRTTDFLAKTKALYMMKPFDAEQLKTEINRILARG